MFIMASGERFVHSSDLKRKWNPTWKKNSSLLHAFVPKLCTVTLCDRVELVLE